MDEIWKDIKGFEGLYQVSNLGRIKHLKGYNHKEEFILTPTPNKKGYLYITLSNGKIKKRIYVHRLVAINFLENTNGKPNIDHINGIRTDNRISNLRWCTHKENCNFPIYRKNSSGVGCWMYKRFLELHPRAKSVAQYDKGGNLVTIWKTAKEAELSTGIRRSGICQCCKKTNNRKTAGGFIWKYVKE